MSIGRPRKAGESGVAYEQAVQLAQAGKHKEADAAFARIAAGAPRAIACWRGCAKPPSWRRRTIRLRWRRMTPWLPIRRSVRSFRIWPACAPVCCSSTVLPDPELQKRLEPLTVSGRPFRHTARELLALSAWKSRRPQCCAEWTDMIMTDPETPGGIRSRAQILSDLIAANGSKG